MEITQTTKHTVTFEVHYFENSEGGMETEQYGEEVNTLPEAIDLLTQAKEYNRHQDWKIVCKVETKTTKAM